MAETTEKQDVTQPDFSLDKGVEPATTEASQTEASPETKTETPEDQISSLKAALAEKDKVINDNSAKLEEQDSRIESLQESLDAALESVQFPNNTPQAEPVDEENTSEETTTDETTKEPSAESEEEVPDDLAKEIEETLAEGDKEETPQQPEVIEDLLMDNEVRNLKDELNSALTKYPEANKGEILLAIEDGSDLSVDELAKTSAERIKTEREANKKAIEESLKEQFSKENEGSISVPQSSGSPSTPTNATPPSEPLSPDEAWAQALKAAKADSKGV